MMVGLRAWRRRVADLVGRIVFCEWTTWPGLGDLFWWGREVSTSVHVLVGASMRWCVLAQVLDRRSRCDDEISTFEHLAE